MDCKKCQKHIPYRFKIGEKLYTGNSGRVYCFECKPYKKREATWNDAIRSKNIWQKGARRKRKEQVVAFFGGKCSKCGYDRCIDALDFHHRDPNKKLAGLSSYGYTRSWDKIIEEAMKCDLVCANCHREIEYHINIGKPLDQLTISSTNLEIYINPIKHMLLLTKEEVEKNLQDIGTIEYSKKLGISDNTLRNFCRNNNITIPPQKRPRKFEIGKNELQKLILEKRNFSQIGRDLGVTDNAIRKRCEILGIEIPKRMNRKRIEQ